MILNRIRNAIVSLGRSLACRPTAYRLLCRLRSQPRILMFHGIERSEAEAFRSQIEFLNQHFRVVPIQQLWDLAPHHDRRPVVVLTFDDGLRNNLTNVYPILRATNTPATFFVCPGLIDSGQWLWNHEARARLSRLNANQRREFARQLALDTDKIYEIVEYMKVTPHARRVVLERSIRDLTPAFAAMDSECESYDLMNWDELRSLDSNLVTIGGHSSYHEILSQLTSDHLEREISQCRQRLQQQLGYPIEHFCYPNGAYTAEVRDCVGRYFATAVTTTKDLVPADASRFELPRIPAAQSWQDLAWRMHRPTG